MYFVLKSQYGSRVDMKNYMLATPTIRLESKSVTGTFLDRRDIIYYYLTCRDSYIYDYEYKQILDALTERSGMEFFFTSFAQIPLTRDGRSAPFEDFIDVKMRDAVSKFYKRLEEKMSYFFFFPNNLIPPNILKRHCWWEKTFYLAPLPEFL